MEIKVMAAREVGEAIVAKTGCLRADGTAAPARTLRRRTGNPVASFASLAARHVMWPCGCIGQK
jgi:hypothetical protein